MRQIGKLLRLIYWTITALALAATVTLATYAWFTSNHRVTTDTATTRTDDSNLTLQISEQGGENFAPVAEANIQQVNQTASDYLLPVSTADLNDFVYNNSTVGNNAKSFKKVEDEKYYYHGRIYLKAEAQGMAEGTRLALYLDQDENAGGAIAQTDSGQLLSAARLGLIFRGDAATSYIFQLTDKYNTSGGKTNTILNEEQLADGQVLDWNNGTVQAQTDPAVSLQNYTVRQTDTGLTLPEQPLLYMNYNQIYQVDVYFYIEGCDPDCMETVYHDEANLHLAFYGMVAEE